MSGSRRLNILPFNIEPTALAAGSRVGLPGRKKQGMTGDGLWIWSGDTLMDLERYQVLKITVKSIGGNDYPFVEAGGFSDGNPAGWKPPWYVMKRAAE
jgi:hypothetical protein